jgi:hypothetical protein
LQVALLNNLRAGRSGAQVGRILSLLRDHPEVIHVETECAGALPEALASIAHREVDLLLVNGGDGTLQHVLTEILAGDNFSRMPMIAPVRGGRTNMSALDLGASRDPVRGIRDVLMAARRGTLSERFVDRPVLKIEYDRGRRIQYGTFFGAGMIRRAIGLTHRVFPTGRSQGVFGAGLVTGWLVLRTLFNDDAGVIKPDKAQIFVDGELVPCGEFRLVIATSLERLFLRMNPFWGDGDGGVRFTAMSSRPKSLLEAGPGILRGSPPALANPENGYTSKCATRVEMRIDCGFTIDGEVFPEQTDEVVRLTADRRLQFVRA